MKKLTLTKIKLNNFRNYKSLQLKFDKNINIIIGNNAQGKTNILESIYVLAITKSHRSGIENNLIKIGEELLSIQGTIKEDKIINDLKINIGQNRKSIFYNNNEIKKLSNYIGNMNVIMFCPDDLDLLKKSPAIRRNYLNIEISQIDNQYIKYLNEYNKILKIKNEYLKVIASTKTSDYRYLDTIEEQLVERAKKIYEYRINYLEEINKKIGIIYYKITKLDGLYIEYDNDFDCDYGDFDLYGNLLKEKYLKNRKREILLGNTIYGPHRDDFIFMLKDIDLKYYGSQGQQRLAIIAFKLAEIELFMEKTGKTPILLLDDIFSEIDIKKRNMLIKYIDGSVQTIITTTDIKNINKKLLTGAKIFKIDNGNITEKVGN